MENYWGKLGIDETDVLPLIEPIVKEVMKAHDDADYALFAQHMTSSLKSKITEEAFMEAHENVGLGQLLEMQFIASLRKGDKPFVLWRARFSETKDDIVIQCAFDEKSDPPKVDWLWIE